MLVSTPPPSWVRGQKNALDVVLAANDCCVMAFTPWDHLRPVAAAMTTPNGALAPETIFAPRQRLVFADGDVPASVLLRFASAAGLAPT